MASTHLLLLLIPVLPSHCNDADPMLIDQFAPESSTSHLYDRKNSTQTGHGRASIVSSRVPLRPPDIHTRDSHNIVRQRMHERHLEPHVHVPEYCEFRVRLGELVQKVLSLDHDHELLAARDDGKSGGNQAKRQEIVGRLGDVDVLEGRTEDGERPEEGQYLNDIEGVREEKESEWEVYSCWVKRVTGCKMLAILCICWSLQKAWDVHFHAY